MATALTWDGITKVMKDYYLTAWRNSINLNTTPLMAEAKHIPVYGSKIKTAAEAGANGGFGFGTDGGATPISGAQLFEAFEESVKDIYCNIEISDKVVKESMKAGNIINPLDSEIKGAFKTAKYHVGRSLYGNGSGVLAFVTAKSGSVLTVNSAKYLSVGARVDVYGGSVASPSIADANKALRITYVDRANNKVTLEKAPSVSSGFLTLQNSFKKELTGLGSIFDTTVTELYGLAKSDHYMLNPITLDAGKDISDSKIAGIIRDSENYNNGAVDMLVCGNKAYDAYAEYLRMNGYRVEDSTLTLKGGFKGIKFLAGNREVAVIDDKFVPDSEMWGFKKDDIKFYDLSDWDYVQHETGGIFTLLPGYSVYRALLACYTNVICANPGGAIRIYNVCDGDSLETLTQSA